MKDFWIDSATWKHVFPKREFQAMNDLDLDLDQDHFYSGYHVVAESVHHFHAPIPFYYLWTDVIAFGRVRRVVIGGYVAGKNGHKYPHNAYTDCTRRSHTKR